MLACGFLSPPELSVTLSGCALFASWQNILGLSVLLNNTGWRIFTSWFPLTAWQRVLAMQSKVA